MDEELTYKIKKIMSQNYADTEYIKSLWKTPEETLPEISPVWLEFSLEDDELRTGFWLFSRCWGTSSIFYNFWKVYKCFYLGFYSS